MVLPRQRPGRLSPSPSAYEMALLWPYSPPFGCQDYSVPQKGRVRRFNIASGPIDVNENPRAWTPIVRPLLPGRLRLTYPPPIDYNSPRRVGPYVAP